jgi:HNH endonuclease
MSREYKRENPEMKTLSSLRGRHVSATGKCWITRKQLSRKVRSLDGQLIPGGNVNQLTDVLVRGTSSQWAHGEYGLKEEHAAALIQSGQKIAIVDDYEFRKLVDGGGPARCSDRVAGQPVEWVTPPPSVKEYDRISSIKGPLDREYTVNGRTEQAYLRSRLFKGQKFFHCALCGIPLPIELLIAAHVKPRSECTLREKRDVKNIAFALCLLGCDALYERGLVSIDNRGRAVTASLKGLPAKLRETLRRLKGRRCNAWNENTMPYFQWHYERRFRGRV